MNSGIYDPVEFFEALLVAAKEGRITIDKKDRKDFHDRKRYDLRFSVLNNSMTGVTDLIQECRSIDLRESLKIASQGNAEKKP